MIVWFLLCWIGTGIGACSQPAAARVGPSADLATTSESTASPDRGVWVAETTITLPTYPVEQYQTDAFDGIYRWPYKRFDVERFRAEAPQPTPRSYRLIVLENEYLRLMMLPELGGRLWQVIHKPSGAPMFYQNAVVKPTHWGQPRQLGWLALGGLEWGIPVIEHGYDWGVSWPVTITQAGPDAAVVTVHTPDDGRLLSATIHIGLRAGEASFTIEPAITNQSGLTLDYSFWIDAILAPGSGNQPSGALHFVLPTDQVQLHSTGDAALPAPGEEFSWPDYAGRDFSRLGNWRQYLGFFESPSAVGPFVGVYDPAYDAGAVRIYPADVARGSKVFGLGWRDALTGDNYSNDDSAYVELHGGVAPSFFEQARLAGGDTLRWQETWYPVHGIGNLIHASQAGALNVVRSAAGRRVGFYPTAPFSGQLVVSQGTTELARYDMTATPSAPFLHLLGEKTRVSTALTFQVEDAAGQAVLRYTEE